MERILSTKNSADQLEHLAAVGVAQILGSLRSVRHEKWCCLERASEQEAGGELEVSKMRQPMTRLAASPFPFASTRSCRLARVNCG